MRGATVRVKCERKACRAEFTARVADRKRGWARFCSKSCKAIKQEQRTGQFASLVHRGRPDRMTTEERDREEAACAMEEGWDGHKNAF